MTRKFSSILLLLAFIPLLGLVPLSNSQSYTTITNQSTTTTQATFTQASQYPIATTTMTSTAKESVYDGSFVLKGNGVRYCYVSSRVHFEAMKGQQVLGTIQTSNPNTLTVYLLSDKQYSIWLSNSYCDPSDSGTTSVLRSSDRVSSYTVNLIVPADGTYTFLIENFSPNDSTVTVSIVKSYPQAITSTIYSTQTSFLVYTATRTLNFASTQELAAPTSLQGDTLIIAVIAVVAIVALVVGYVALSKRKQNPTKM
jgi:hypothetical protein